MGGRGASSGISDKGRRYGTEYHTVLQDGNVKFVKSDSVGSTKTPMETMKKGRVYVTVNDNNELSAITYYDNSGKRTKQIDLKKAHNGLKPHIHHGYIHNENDSKKGGAKLTPKEIAMVDRVNKLWYNKIKK